MPQADQQQQSSFVVSWYFFVTSGLGMTALCLGTVMLFSARKDAIASRVPALAPPVMDWFLFAAGIVLLLAVGTALSVSFHRNRKVRLASGMADDLVATESGARASTMLKPSRSKVLAGVFNAVLFGMALPAFAFAVFTKRPSTGFVFPVFFFFSMGVMFLVGVVDDLSCRVQILDGEIRLWSWFRAKTFPAVEIRSAHYSSYRATTTLVILGDRSWFKVSSNSFDASQLDLIRKFCDQAAKLYPDWSSVALSGAGDADKGALDT